MDLKETREALRRVFENRLAKVYTQIIKGEAKVEGDSYAPIRKMEDVILEYLDCGGTIENGSVFEFAIKVLEQNGSGIKRLRVNEYIDVPSGESLSFTYDEALRRNSNLTLDELEIAIDNYFRNKELSAKSDEDVLTYMSEHLECGGVVAKAKLTDKYFIESIKANPKYLKLFEEIQAKNDVNKATREAENPNYWDTYKKMKEEYRAKRNAILYGEEKSPLQQREEELSAEEAEAKKISEAEVLRAELEGKQGQNKGE